MTCLSMVTSRTPTVTVILALVVPGFIYRASRQNITDPDPEERELAARVGYYVTTSAW